MKLNNPFVVYGYKGFIFRLRPFIRVISGIVAVQVSRGYRSAARYMKMLNARLLVAKGVVCACVSMGSASCRVCSAEEVGHRVVAVAGFSAEVPIG